MRQVLAWDVDGCHVFSTTVSHFGGYGKTQNKLQELE